MTKKLSILMLLATLGLQAEITSNPTELRVMTYNVRRDGKEEDKKLSWSHRVAKLVTVINQYRPDILHLQEPVESQVEDIQRRLGSEYSWIGEPRGHRWPGFDTNEYNPIFYKPAIVTLIASGTFSINAPFSYVGALFSQFKETGALPRIATWALFQVNATGRYVFSVNTHFDNKKERARAHNMRNLLAGIAKVTAANPGTPVILTGDFNCDAPQVFNDQLNQAGFSDAKKIAQYATGPFNTGSAFLPKVRTKPIDHLFVRPGNESVTVKSYTTHDDQTNASDHNPRIIDVVW